MPVTLRANYIGSLAAKALSTSDSRTAGQVLSTFSTSFYLRTASNELLFVTNRSLRSPITINVDSGGNFDRTIRPSQPIQFEKERIRLGSDATINLSEASYDHTQSGMPSEPSPEFAGMKAALQSVSFILRLIDTNQSVLDPNDLVYGGARNLALDGVLPLREPRGEKRFRDAGLKVVGLGSGFTPAGDDMLGGFLVLYNSLARTVQRRPIVFDFADLEARTSWISGKLLDYMQRVIVDEQIDSVIDAAARGDHDSLILSLETLFPRGHTSGIDISTGAILALSLLRDIALHSQETETILSALGFRT
jgi:hypothetical protein